MSSIGTYAKSQMWIDNSNFLWRFFVTAVSVGLVVWLMILVEFDIATSMLCVKMVAHTSQLDELFFKLYSRVVPTPAPV
ncbi:hypothetical protein B0H63DRAFT_524695 [Podospora didyma]|uniref:Uncharacterized protein n=1 Tax=Podospora didyma TaxID=330526 RepID=A0AAE0NI91_9PEZI|nr:hypothetical protein B0H63DRAFT_524695 [Podospora didyma]